MTNRTHAPAGAPCWVDLWTSDVEGSRRFYSELFGWEAGESTPQFGGYFMFSLGGVPIAGGMGSMPDAPAPDLWKIYLATDHIDKTLEAASAAGAEVVSPAMPVGDLGVQAVLHDPTGAHLGLWQAGTFPGFTVLEVPGAPSWFELRTRDHARAIGFYRSVLGWGTTEPSGHRRPALTAMRAPGGEGAVAGILDAGTSLPEGVASHWSIYWQVEDVDRAVDRVGRLGGAVVDAPSDTPFGRRATVTDHAGAELKLHAPNR